MFREFSTQIPVRSHTKLQRGDVVRLDNHWDGGTSDYEYLGDHPYDPDGRYEAMDGSAVGQIPDSTLRECNARRIEVDGA